MGKEERREISRIKVENLPTVAESYLGGFIQKEPLANGHGVLVSIGRWISFYDWGWQSI